MLRSAPSPSNGSHAQSPPSSSSSLSSSSSTHKIDSTNHISFQGADRNNHKKAKSRGGSIIQSSPAQGSKSQRTPAKTTTHIFRHVSSKYAPPILTTKHHDPLCIWFQALPLWTLALICLVAGLTVVQIRHFWGVSEDQTLQHHLAISNGENTKNNKNGSRLVIMMTMDHLDNNKSNSTQYFLRRNNNSNLPGWQIPPFPVSVANMSQYQKNRQVLEDYYQPQHLKRVMARQDQKREAYRKRKQKRLEKRKQNMTEEYRQKMEHLIGHYSNTSANEGGTQKTNAITNHNVSREFATMQDQWTSCLMRANQKHIRSHVDTQRPLGLPLLASVILAPIRLEQQQQKQPTLYWTATFSLCDVTWRKPGRQRLRIPEVSNSSHWRCDDQPAHVVAQGCPSGTTVSIQCPQQQQAALSRITYMPQNYTYHVRDLVACEEVVVHDVGAGGGNRSSLLPFAPPLSAATAAAPQTTVASALVYQVSNTMLLEWVEYHRMIGVDHFWVYVMQDDVLSQSASSNTPESLSLPELPYITYIPWNLNPQMQRTWDIFLFQTAAQVDSLHRARRLGIQWVLYNDLDEFLLIKKKGFDGEQIPALALSNYLEEKNTYDAIQIPTVAFGSQAPLSKAMEFQLNYTWRTVQTFGQKRCKSLVQASRIDYYNIHWATEPNTNIHKVTTNEAWIHHYKKPHKGVFRRELHNKDITADTTLRDRFLEPVRSRVHAILAAQRGASTSTDTKNHHSEG